MRHLYFGAILSAVISCDSKPSSKDFVEYEEGRQLLTVNNFNRDGSAFNIPKIETLAPDSILIGEEFFAKIFLTDTDLIIADAFVGCENVENASVDTVTNKVSGCRIGLIIKDDTVLIAFRPDSVGLKTFAPITILTKDKDRVFRTLRYTFDYKVLQN